MPDATPRLALPYPVSADTVDVPRDVQALAVKLDGLDALAPSVVTDLPAGAQEGDEVILSFTPTVVPAFVGTVLWRVRFSGGWWLPLGVTPVWAIQRTEVTVAGAAFVGTTPQLTVPFAGDYVLEASVWGIGTNNPAAANYHWGFGNNTKSGGFAANFIVAANVNPVGANYAWSSVDASYALDQGRGDILIHGHRIIDGTLPVTSEVRAMKLTPYRLKAV